MSAESEISGGGERDVNERTSAGYASVGWWVWGDPASRFVPGSLGAPRIGFGRSVRVRNDHRPPGAPPRGTFKQHPLLLHLHADRYSTGDGHGMTCRACTALPMHAIIGTACSIIRTY
jgi:hypothetical protein